MAYIYPLRLVKMNTLKILFTIPNFDTAGSGKALLNIALGLDREIFEPEIMCLHPRGSFFKVVEASGIPVHIYNYLGKARPITKLCKDSWRISRKFKEIAPHVIHSFNYSADYTEAMAAKLAGISWVFTKKNMSWRGPSQNAWKLRSFLAKKIVVQNTDMITQFYPSSTKTVLIPRGVNTNAFTPGKAIQAIRTQMKTEANQRVLICVANFVPVKGVELLIEAFSRLQNAFPKWVLWLVGDIEHEYGKSLQASVFEKKLDKKILFSGKQLNVLPFLHCSDIFILPTKETGEGSPVALLEAMAAGVCVVGSKVSGIKDQLSNFETHLFEPENVEDLVACISPFMKLESSILKEKGLVFSNHSKQKYDINLEIKKHQSLYKELV